MSMEIDKQALAIAMAELAKSIEGEAILIMLNEDTVHLFTTIQDGTDIKLALRAAFESLDINMETHVFKTDVKKEEENNYGLN